MNREKYSASTWVQVESCGSFESSALGFGRVGTNRRGAWAQEHQGLSARERNDREMLGEAAVNGSVFNLDATQ